MSVQDLDFFFVQGPYAYERRLKAAAEAGLAHISRIEPCDPLPGQTVTLSFSTPADTAIDHIAVYYTTDGSIPQGAMGNAQHGTALFAIQVGRTTNSKIKLDLVEWQAIIPAQSDQTLVRYRADAWQASNLDSHSFADSSDPISDSSEQGRVFAYHVDQWQAPQWWQNAAVYHIFVDRFNAETPLPPYTEGSITSFFGGNLDGIRAKLDYIQSLGCNCLWLSPIFVSPSHHGYNASNFFQVDARFGGNEALQRLVAELHQRGMRILLDIAPNHTSDLHPAFLAAQSNPSAPTRQWYDFDERYHPGYRSYVGVKDMPELQTEVVAVQDYFRDALRFWLDMGIDGFRLDYVAGPSHAFWTNLYTMVKQYQPEAMTLGEITADLAGISTYAGRMDGFIDFPFIRALRQTFAARSLPLADFLTMLTERQKEMPPMGRATGLDNHDMHRFLWLAEGDKRRLLLAATCDFTLDGTPILYYGTEIGLSQYDDALKETAHARAPMLWQPEQQDSTILQHYQALLRLRQASPCLRVGKTSMIPVNTRESEQETQVGAYLRQIDEEKFLVVLNNNEQESLVTLPCLSIGVARWDTEMGRDLLTQQLVVRPKNNQLEIRLAPLEAIILQLTASEA